MSEAYSTALAAIGQLSDAEDTTSLYLLAGLAIQRIEELDRPDLLADLMRLSIGPICNELDAARNCEIKHMLPTAPTKTGGATSGATAAPLHH